MPNSIRRLLPYQAMRCHGNGASVTRSAQRAASPAAWSLFEDVLAYYFYELTGPTANSTLAQMMPLRVGAPIPLEYAKVIGKASIGMSLITHFHAGLRAPRCSDKGQVLGRR